MTVSQKGVEYNQATGRFIVSCKFASDVTVITLLTTSFRISYPHSITFPCMTVSQKGVEYNQATCGECESNSQGKLKCTFIVSRKFALDVTVIALLTMSLRVLYLHSNRSGRSAGTNAASYYPPPDLNPRSRDTKSQI